MKTSAMADMTTINGDYQAWLQAIKSRVTAARQRAALAVNAELIMLYWSIGCEILQRQDAQGWGSKIIERLGQDLRSAFPEMKGFSARNLKYMRTFAELFPDEQFVQQIAAQIPWWHNVLIMTRIKDPAAQRFYMQKAIDEGWTRTTLEVQIKHQLYERQGMAVSNFQARLPVSQAIIAQQSLKDPYFFDFLGLGEDAAEREIETALIQHISQFLLELGSGFAYVGRQFRLEVAGDEFFIDLLFYHTRLKCYVVIELKATAFKPDHAGQLNFYLAAVDAQIKAEDDKPTIGLLLCRTKNQLVAEYALSGMDKPMGIAEYELVRELPKSLATTLPSVETLENELAHWEQDYTTEQESDE